MQWFCSVDKTWEDSVVIFPYGMISMSGQCLWTSQYTKIMLARIVTSTTLNNYYFIFYAFTLLAINIMKL